MNQDPFRCTCRFNEDGETTCGVHEQTVTYYDDRQAQE